MHSSLSIPEEFNQLDIPDASVWYIENFYPADRALELEHELYEQIDWRTDKIRIFGKEHMIPRLHAFYGDQGLCYRYSGISNAALNWSSALKIIRDELSVTLKIRFNSVLCNLYRDGNDSNGWHADDEKELGVNPVIASLSFGESRDFQFKRRNTGERLDIKLVPGSLLIMAGQTQSNWLHCVPKRKRCTSPRINLTFRQILLS